MMLEEGLTFYLKQSNSYQMPLETLEALEVLKTKFTKVEDGEGGELLWVWRKVPRLQPVPAQLNTVYVLHPRDDVIVTAVRHQTTSHARGRGDTIRTVLRILRAESRVREMVGRHLTAVNNFIISLGKSCYHCKYQELLIYYYPNN